MKLVKVATIAAVLALPVIAAAQGPSGMSGYVLDAATKAPIAGISVVVARDEVPPRERHELVTDRHGFFTDLALRPGNYIVVTEAHGHLVNCIVEDVRSDVVRHVRILIGHSVNETRCVGRLVRNDTVDPDETASLYRVH